MKAKKVFFKVWSRFKKNFRSNKSKNQFLGLKSKKNYLSLKKCFFRSIKQFLGLKNMLLDLKSQVKNR